MCTTSQIIQTAILSVIWYPSSHFSMKYSSFSSSFSEPPSLTSQGSVFSFRELLPMRETSTVTRKELCQLWSLHFFFSWLAQFLTSSLLELLAISLMAPAITTCSTKASLFSPSLAWYGVRHLSHLCRVIFNSLLQLSTQLRENQRQRHLWLRPTGFLESWSTVLVGKSSLLREK